MSSFPMNRSMMSAEVIPLVMYPDVHAASGWLCRAFAFKERLVIGDHRIQMDVGDGSLVLVKGELPAMLDAHPVVMIRVADAQQHSLQAEAAGATIISPPTDQPYGERQYTASDLVGRRWTFSQTIADVEPKSWGGIERS